MAIATLNTNCFCPTILLALVCSYHERKRTSNTEERATVCITASFSFDGAGRHSTVCGVSIHKESWPVTHTLSARSCKVQGWVSWGRALSGEGRGAISDLSDDEAIVGLSILAVGAGHTDCFFVASLHILIGSYSPWRCASDRELTCHICISAAFSLKNTTGDGTVWSVGVGDEYCPTTEGLHWSASVVCQYRISWITSYRRKRRRAIPYLSDIVVVVSNGLKSISAWDTHSLYITSHDIAIGRDSERKRSSYSLLTCHICIKAAFSLKNTTSDSTVGGILVLEECQEVSWTDCRRRGVILKCWIGRCRWSCNQGCRAVHYLSQHKVFMLDCLLTICALNADRFCPTCLLRSRACDCKRWTCSNCDVRASIGFRAVCIFHNTATHGAAWSVLVCKEGRPISNALSGYCLVSKCGIRYCRALGCEGSATVSDLCHLLVVVGDCLFSVGARHAHGLGPASLNVLIRRNCVGITCSNR